METSFHLARLPQIYSTCPAPWALEFMAFGKWGINTEG